MTSTEGDKQLIDPATDADLQSKPRQKTPSGLEYQEVVPGKGPSPSIGIQVHCMTICCCESHDNKIGSDALPARLFNTASARQCGMLQDDGVQQLERCTCALPLHRALTITYTSRRWS